MAGGVSVRYTLVDRNGIESTERRNGGSKQLTDCFRIGGTRARRRRVTIARSLHPFDRSPLGCSKRIRRLGGRAPLSNPEARN